MEGEEHESHGVMQSQRLLTPSPHQLVRTPLRPGVFWKLDSGQTTTAVQLGAWRKALGRGRECGLWWRRWEAWRWSRQSRRPRTTGGQEKHCTGCCWGIWKLCRPHRTLKRPGTVNRKPLISLNDIQEVTVALVLHFGVWLGWQAGNTWLISICRYWLGYVSVVSVDL